MSMEVPSDIQIWDEEHALVPFAYLYLDSCLHAAHHVTFLRFLVLLLGSRTTLQQLPQGLRFASVLHLTFLFKHGLFDFHEMEVAIWQAMDEPALVPLLALEGKQLWALDHEENLLELGVGLWSGVSLHIEDLEFRSFRRARVALSVALYSFLDK